MGESYIDTADIFYCPGQETHGHPDFERDPGRFSETGRIAYGWLYRIHDSLRFNHILASENQHHAVVFDMGWAPWVSARGRLPSHRGFMNVLRLGGSVDNVQLDFINCYGGSTAMERALNGHE